MHLYENLSVYSTDTFSEHYSQARSSLPPLGDNFPLSTRFVNITDILTVTLVTTADSCWHD